jgi:hypothetical protein
MIGAIHSGLCTSCCFMQTSAAADSGSGWPSRDIVASKLPIWNAKQLQSGTLNHNFSCCGNKFSNWTPEVALAILVLNTNREHAAFDLQEVDVPIPMPSQDGITLACLLQGIGGSKEIMSWHTVSWLWPIRLPKTLARRTHVRSCF